MILDAAFQALSLILEPQRLGFLSLGVIIGLVLGMLPGIGGLAGLALLLPFTFTMDPYTAFAFLLGLMAVTSTSDTIPAVLFGVPGTAGSQATVLDGFPMARKGEAGRALSAAYTASLIGGLFGALLLAISLPFLRSIAQFIGSPELLSFAIFGISMVAVLSGNAPLRGLGIGALGVMLALFGIDVQTATLRWTHGSMYLWDGLSLVPLTLGLFALPELCDMAIRRTAIAEDGSKHDVRTGMIKGAKDVLHNRWLMLRCSFMGAGLGAVPGIGTAIIDWLAYAHALRTEKGAQDTFGTGDVRGVIAPESANNAKEAGSLVPTIAFGIPGSAGTAILLGAFLVHGLVPGPDMLTKNLDLTYSMVWSIAIANILGAGLCYLLSGQFAKLATLRVTIVVPVVLSITIIGAYSASNSWGDLYLLLIVGVLGWVMKQLKWPRAPLMLGFVLGATIERYAFITINRFGLEFLLRPIVILLLVTAAISLTRPLIREIRNEGGIRAMAAGLSRPVARLSDLFSVLLILAFGALVWEAHGWPFAARIVPLIVGYFGMAVVLTSLAFAMMRRQPDPETGRERAAKGLHLDVSADHGDQLAAAVAIRALSFLAWIVGFLCTMAVIGFIPTLPLFVIAYMYVNGREKWWLMLPMAAGLTLLVVILFDQGLGLRWPSTLLGDWLPALRVIPSV